MFSEMAQTAQRWRPGRGRHWVGSLRGLGGLGRFVGLFGRQHPLCYDPCLFAHKLKRKFRYRGGSLLIWFKSLIHHPHYSSHVDAIPYCPLPPGQIPRSMFHSWCILATISQLSEPIPLINVAHSVYD